MSDLDVQDIRDMVAQQREDALRQQEALAEVRRAAENPPTEKTPAELLEKYKVAEAKQHERNKRLGLESGKFFFLSSILVIYSPYNSAAFHQLNVGTGSNVYCTGLYSTNTISPPNSESYRRHYLTCQA